MEKEADLAILKGTVQENERGYRLKPSIWEVDRYPWELYLMFPSREIDKKKYVKVTWKSINIKFLTKNSRF